MIGPGRYPPSESVGGLEVGNGPPYLRLSVPGLDYLAGKLPLMDGKVDLFTLLTLIVALVLILKLRSVLGRRTGDDEQRILRNRAEQQRQEATARAAEKVVTLPRRDRDEPAVAETPAASVAEAEARRP